jgi:hypothetical protein
VYYSGGVLAEKGLAIFVRKIVVRTVVKKIVNNDRIIAIKLQAEPIFILLIQVFTRTSDHEDGVEDLRDIIEEILKEDGKWWHKHHHNGGLEECFSF